MTRDPHPVQNRAELADTPAKRTALDCLAAGIEAARPERAVESAVAVEGTTLRVSGAVAGEESGRETVSGAGGHGAVTVDLAAFDRILVVGGGKAAAGLVRGLHSTLDDAGFAPDDGTVLVPDDAAGRVGSVELVAGGHPTPTESGVAATRRALAELDAADEDTLVLAPITGGGSALLAAPVVETADTAGVSLSALQSVTDELLDAGADIGSINTVRTHLSAVKGGKLAARAAPATVIGLLVSDVAGDDPGVIASGPTVPDATTPADAVAVLDRFGIDAPEVRAVLADRGAQAADGDRTATADGTTTADSTATADGTTTADDTATADRPTLDSAETVVVADVRTALRAARDAAVTAGYDARILSDRVTGEARVRGRIAAALASAVTDCGDRPTVLLSGGETTVTVTGDGRGGPNCEYALAAGGELARRELGESVAVGAVDTDGLDGSTDAAGGLLDGTTVSPAQATDALDANDSLSVLSAVGAAVRTGPTGTNVNDLRVIVVE
ncbi:MAG: glycerate kinase [Halobaculum sp.]